jgi:hypothetical protein
MKNRMTVFGATTVLLSLVLLGGCAPRKYVPKAYEECYGTWINEKGFPQKVVIFAGGWGNYVRIADTVATYNEGPEEIEAKWIDSEGNVWYKFFGTITAGQGAGEKFQTLARISKSGTVYERVAAMVAEFSPKNYPTKIDPNSGNSGYYYNYFTRSGN